MSIQVPITPSSLKKLQKELRTKKTVICLDPDSFIRTLLVGREMLMRGESIARIKKGYEERV